MKFPIISLSHNNPNVYAFADEKTSKTCGVDLLYVHNESIILDAEGIEYFIASAHKVKWAYIFGYHPFYKGRSVIVDFNISDKKQLQLDGFKQIVVERLNKGVKPPFWYTKKEIPWLKSKVEEANSFKQVIEIFLYDLS